MYGLWSFINTGVYFLASLHVFWDILSIVLFEPTHHTGQLPSTLPSRESSGKCNMAIGGGEVASYKGGGECHILAMGWWNTDFTVWGGERLRWWMSEVVNVWGGECLGWWTSDFTLGVVNVWGGECLGWWTSEVVNVWGGERLGWWTSDFTQGVVNVWGGERLGWWTSDFTQGVMNVWGSECLGGERLTICRNCYPIFPSETA